MTVENSFISALTHEGEHPFGSTSVTHGIKIIFRAYKVTQLQNFVKTYPYNHYPGQNTE